ncbi:MAG: serine/threonine-protein kinase [Rikenellaceae bacterium]
MYNSNYITLVADNNEEFCLYENDNFRIGGGAMGTVYKGWSVKNPEYKVAIKKIHCIHANNHNIRQRSKHESSLRINHPNIIKMLGYAEPTPNRGSIYIISELMRGVTVNEYISSIAPEIRLQRLSEIMCSILDGLDMLHNQPLPIFHRDIKPSNIMVEYSGNARLMDLGIATSDGVSHGTLNGFAGTAAFTSPEQINSSRFGGVSGRSDIYSLGVTFYTLLTGVNPFAEDVTSEIEILNRQISLTLPNHVNIPSALIKVLRKATAKVPQDRYQTAKEFKLAIAESMKPRRFSSGLFSNDTDILIIAISLAIAVIMTCLVIFTALS